MSLAKIKAGDKVKISNSKTAIWWDVLGIRKALKNAPPSQVLLIIRSGKTIRRNVNILKVCVAQKMKEG